MTGWDSRNCQVAQETMQEMRGAEEASGRIWCSCIRVELLCRVRGIVCVGWHVCKGCCWCCGVVCVLMCSAGGVLWCGLRGLCSVGSPVCVLGCCEVVCWGWRVTGGECVSVSCLVGHSLSGDFTSAKVLTVATACHRFPPD